MAVELFTPHDLIQLARPGVPVTSPNGTFAVYSQSAYNIEQAKVSFFSERRERIEVLIRHPVYC